MFLKRPHYTVKKKISPNGTFRKLFHTNLITVQWWIWQGHNRQIPRPPPPPPKKKDQVFIIFKTPFCIRMLQNKAKRG